MKNIPACILPLAIPTAPIPAPSGTRLPTSMWSAASSTYGSMITRSCAMESSLWRHSPAVVTSQQSGTELLKKAYAAFNARDLDGALATMKPDVVWPNGMEGGVVHGHEGVRSYWTRQWGMIDPHVDPAG